MKTKNELKTPLFIFIKHLINDMNESSASRIERYITNYFTTNAPDNDKELIKTMFQTKLKTI